MDNDTCVISFNPQTNTAPQSHISDHKQQLWLASNAHSLFYSPILPQMFRTGVADDIPISYAHQPISEI